jgi:hypothetical protein
VVLLLARDEARDERAVSGLDHLGVGALLSASAFTLSITSCWRCGAETWKASRLKRAASFT